MSDILSTGTGNYLQHEAWFELDNITKEVGGSENIAPRIIQGKRLINSYGRVREVWEDGTYYDVKNGEYKP